MHIYFKVYEWHIKAAKVMLSAGKATSIKEKFAIIPGLALFIYIVFDLLFIGSLSNMSKISQILIFTISFYGVIYGGLFNFGAWFGRFISLPPQRNFDMRSSAKQGAYIGLFTYGIMALDRFFRNAGF